MISLHFIAVAAIFSGHDCGVYALLFAEALCRVKLEGAPTSTLTELGGSTAKQWRVDTRRLIHTLATKS